MPYIKVINGVMQEFNNSGVNTGPVNTCGFNAYSYMEDMYWSSNSYTGTAYNPTYSVDFPFLAANGIKYLKCMFIPYANSGVYDFATVVGQATFNADNSVAALNINSSYITQVQGLFTAAATNGLGIFAIVSNIGLNSSITAMCGETYPLCYSNYYSKTRNYIRSFVAWFVTQFQSNLSIAAWSCFVEANNTVKDNVLLASLVKDVATAIRTNDPLSRMIAGGHAGEPGGYGIQNSFDSYLNNVVAAINPSPVDCVELHVYSTNAFTGNPSGLNSYIGTYTNDFEPFVAQIQAFCKKIGKPFFAGEWGIGVNNAATLGDSTNQNVSSALALFQKYGVQLSMIWDWNAYPTMSPNWNIITGQGYSEQAGVFNLIVSQNTLQVGAPATNLIPAYKNATKFVPPFAQALDFWPLASGNALTNGFTAAGSSGFSAGAVSVVFSIFTKGFSNLLDTSIINARASNTGWAIVDYLHAATSYILWLDSGTGFGTDTSTGIYPNNTTGRWYRLAFTFANGSAPIVYTNGFQQQAGNVYSGFVNAQNPIQFGSISSWPTPTPYILSDVQVFNRALTPLEVYNDYLGNYASSPIGRWTLNGNLLDSSGYGNNGYVATGQTMPSFVNTGMKPRLARI